MLHNSNNNISITNYINVLSDFQELLLPLHSNQKRPIVKNWPNKQFTSNDFKHSTKHSL